MAPSEESFLDVDVSDAVEPVAVAAGEYELRLLGGVIDKNKKGKPYFQPRFDIPSEPNSKDFTDYIGLPHDEMSEKDLNRAKWRLKAFKACFGIEESAKISLTDDLPGLTGWCILGLKDDPEYGEQNTIRKYLAPK